MSIRVIKPGIELVTPPEMFPLQLQVIETMGRTCYQSEAKSTTPEPFIERIALNYGHLSVIRHGVASFRFVVDRADSHQQVRHQIGSEYSIDGDAISQESQRYCNYNRQGELLAVEPHGFDGEQRDIWYGGVLRAYEDYKALLYTGARPEKARSVLPNCVKTEVGATYNFSQWRHVFKERALNPRAYENIRAVMQMALTVLNKHVPCMFKDLYELLEGTPDIDVRHLATTYQVRVVDGHRELIDIGV